MFSLNVGCLKATVPLRLFSDPLSFQLSIDIVKSVARPLQVPQSHHTILFIVLYQCTLVFVNELSSQVKLTCLTIGVFLYVI